MPSPAKKSNHLFALVPSAGSGARAGLTRPKQYQPIAGIPLVIHTLRAWTAVTRVQRGLVVVSSDDTEMHALLQRYSVTQFQVAAVGGHERSDSVLAGLRALIAQGAQADDWVLVHDAARCFITAEQINRLIDACIEDDVGGLLAQPLADTLKSANDSRVAGTITRSDKWLAQTPQMFRIGTLQYAIEQAGASVTDESSAMEVIGLHPKLVACGSHNMKVTYPQDFALAEAIFQMRKN